MVWLQLLFSSTGGVGEGGVFIDMFAVPFVVLTVRLFVVVVVIRWLFLLGVLGLVLTWMVALVGMACLDVIFVVVVITVLVLELCIFNILVAFAFLGVREPKSVEEGSR